MTVRTAEVLVGGLGFTESPRWHDDRLWYIDIPAHSVRAVDLHGRDELIETLPDRISAIDFLPDGAVVVALADERRVLRLDDRSVHADLRELGTGGGCFLKVNDMVVDAKGFLYLDCNMPGLDLDRPERDIGDAIAVVGPDGACRIATAGVFSPNGLAITPDGGQLVVAEPTRRRLVSFDIEPDGGLRARGLFADIAPSAPDGICTDSEGAVWATGMHSREVLRVHAGGAVSERIIAADRHWTIATMTGGPDRRHLFIATSELPTGQLRSRADVTPAIGFIEVIDIETPGGGWPGN